MLKPVYALVGSEPLLQIEALGKIVRQAPEGTPRVDFDGPYAEIGDVLEELQTQSMFAAGKIVVLRRVDERDGPRQAFVTQFREQLENYVEKASGSTAVLVLRMNTLPKTTKLYKLIAKRGQIADCDPPADPVRWMVDRAGSVHGLKMAPAAARALKELVGADLGRLDNELAKLALTCHGTADEAAVLGSVAFQRKQDIKELIHSVARGDVPAAMRRWRLLQLDPSMEFRASTWLLMWLEDVRAVLTPGVPFKNIWRYEGFENEFRRFAVSLGPAKVGRLIDQLAEADWRSKSGLGDAVSNIERFLLALGR